MSDKLDCLCNFFFFFLEKRFQVPPSLSSLSPLLEARGALSFVFHGVWPRGEHINLPPLSR